MEAACSSETFITGAETILFTVPKQLWGPLTPCPRVAGGYFPQGNAVRDEDVQLPPSSAEVNAWSCTSIPLYLLGILWLIKHRNHCNEDLGSIMTGRIFIGCPKTPFRRKKYDPHFSVFHHTLGLCICFSENRSETCYTYVVEHLYVCMYVCITGGP
jgi:hypothetical protein